MPRRKPGTRILAVDPAQPATETIAVAAAALRSGRLVAFPTETVYGLGANALDPYAVAGIFTAKGRPAHNPVIVHVPDADAAAALGSAWSEVCRQLAAVFWPGPLTLVTPRSAVVPDIVTAGGPTVALRVPSHLVAQALLHAAGVPVAAPSANRSSRISPTTAEHVRAELGGLVHIILDGGPTECGLESTVVDCTLPMPRILRPGPISPSQIALALGLAPDSISAVDQHGEGPLRSPGMLPRHYAPQAQVIVVPAAAAHDAVRSAVEAGLAVGWLTMSGSTAVASARLHAIRMPDAAAGYAHLLYAALRALDARSVDRIVVDDPPSGEDWLAVHDRLSRAAAPADRV
ncbi:MAG: threonylcarbamoyl-AMP synthase [Armatimonadetes bacterium]|nr:threonylcarbamoyl-AMP synthase [Armatimonadota bacterium]MDE2205125.1 threonylcarbamoyl-AMP synthase [Armatimonadota bacterium]